MSFPRLLPFRGTEDTVWAPEATPSEALSPVSPQDSLGLGQPPDNVFSHWLSAHMPRERESCRREMLEHEAAKTPATSLIWISAAESSCGPRQGTDFWGFLTTYCFTSKVFKMLYPEKAPSKSPNDLYEPTFKA